MALLLGATFVARSFSGDKQQLVPLIKAAIAHKGAAFIDVISPCVAFNNHAGSTKSFDFVREHNEAVNRLDIMASRMPIKVEYAPGTVEIVEQHDGSKLALRKLAADYDPHRPHRGDGLPAAPRRQGRVVTGLLYVEKSAEDLHAHLNTVDDAAQRARRKRALPRPGGARQDQRQLALGRQRQPAWTTRRLGQSDLHFAPLMLGSNVFGWNVDEKTVVRHSRCLRRCRLQRHRHRRQLFALGAGPPGRRIRKPSSATGSNTAASATRCVIATKVGEDMGEGRSLQQGLHFARMRGLAARLQTDRIDLYQTHFDDEVTPVEGDHAGLCAR